MTRGNWPALVRLALSIGRDRAAGARQGRHGAGGSPWSDVVAYGGRVVQRSIVLPRLVIQGVGRYRFLRHPSPLACDGLGNDRALSFIFPCGRVASAERREHRERVYEQI